MNTNKTKHEDDLKLLAELVADLPPVFKTKFAPLVLSLTESHERRTRILGLVQSALGQLRLDMKYIAFDLEATRRERDDYKAKLEGK
jgi:hypothetical protein